MLEEVGVAITGDPGPVSFDHVPVPVAGLTAVRVVVFPHILIVVESATAGERSTTVSGRERVVSPHPFVAVME